MESKNCEEKKIIIRQEIKEIIIKKNIYRDEIKRM